MCGFSAIFGTERNNIIKDWLKFSSPILQSRGPDHEGQYLGKNFGLLHRRLAIVDLSINGNQPFESDNGNIFMVFNGEIYNHLDLRSEYLKKHSFKSTSDSETILKGYEIYGLNFFKYVRGMYSICFYNKRENSVSLIRDRMGEKPLYYFIEKEMLCVSSLFTPLVYFSSKEIDRDSLDYYSTFGFLPNKSTLYTDIKKLEHGTSLEFNCNNGTLNLKKIPKYQNEDKLDLKLLDEKQIKNEISEILNLSVLERVKADVPVSIFLSGGLDSSLITSIASRYNSDINTFTVSFPDNKNFNESQYAREISNTFKTNHYEFNLCSRDIFSLEVGFDLLDEPLADPSYLITNFLCENVSKFNKVALTGDGADELQFGYGTHLNLMKIEKIYNKIFFKKLFRDICFYSLERRIITNKAIKKIISVYDFNDKKTINSDLLNPPTKLINDPKIANSLGFKLTEYFDKPNSIKKGHYNLLDILRLCDLNNYLPNNILVKADRASMNHGLELRSPFLDERLVDYCTSLSSNAFISNKTKIPIRKIAKKNFPRKILNRRKAGFELPLVDMIKNGPIRDRLFDFSENSLILNRSNIDNIYSLYERKLIRSKAIYGLCSLLSWENRIRKF